MANRTQQEQAVREMVNRFKSLESDPAMTNPEVASNEAAVFARDKVFAIARTLGSLLEQTPVTLINGHGLNQLSNNLSGPLNELTAFVSNKNTGHLQNAASQMEQNILPLFINFAPTGPWREAETVQYIESVRSSAALSISQLASERDSLRSQLDELRATLNKQQERIETLNEATARERAEAAAQVSTLQRQFEEKEAERLNAFNQLIAQLNGDFSSFKKSSEDTANAHVATLAKLRDDAAKIVHVVGNIGVTGNYKQIAKNEGDQANFWRWATVLFFACGVGIAVATFVKYYDATIDSSNVWTIAIRLMYAIAITAPAWYTARESARHRTNSDRAQQMELELASIGPFIELMPEDKKNEIREKLTQVFFGRPTEPHVVKHPLDMKQIKILVETVAKAVRSP